MLIDWNASKEDWIAAVRNGPLQILQADRRFNIGALAAKFDQDVATWSQTNRFRPVIETTGFRRSMAVCHQ